MRTTLPLSVSFVLFDRRKPCVTGGPGRKGNDEIKIRPIKELKEVRDGDSVSGSDPRGKTNHLGYPSSRNGSGRTEKESL